VSANSGAIGLAEQLVGAVMAVVEGHPLPQPPLSAHPRAPTSRDDYTALVTSLTSAVREMVARWQRLPVGGTSVLYWPEQPRGRAIRPRHPGHGKKGRG
jgi:hypothetical protein